MYGNANVIIVLRNTRAYISRDSWTDKKKDRHVDSQIEKAGDRKSASQKDRQTYTYTSVLNHESSITLNRHLCKCPKNHVL